MTEKVKLALITVVVPATLTTLSTLILVLAGNAHHAATRAHFDAAIKASPSKP